MRSSLLATLLLLPACGPRHCGEEAPSVGGARARLPHANPEDAPDLEILVPEGWVLEDHHRGAREGLIAFVACVESKTPWEWGGTGPLAKERVGASVCVDWGPEKQEEVLGGQPFLAPPLEKSFEMAYPPPKLEWEFWPREAAEALYASRKVTWGGERAVEVHGLSGYLHEKGRLVSSQGELGTIENLALDDGAYRVALAAWIPPGAPAPLQRRIYREAHAILLSIAPVGPETEPRR